MQHEEAVSDVEAERARTVGYERQIADLRTQLADAESNSARLQRESEFVIQNINKWVEEQKYSSILSLCISLLCFHHPFFFK